MGNIYSQRPHVTTWDNLIDKFTVNEKINCLMFSVITEVPTAKLKEDGKAITWDSKWIFEYVYSSKFDEDSETTFDNILGDLIKKFHDDSSLSETIISHDDLVLRSPKTQKSVAASLVHYAELELNIKSQLLASGDAITIPDQVSLSSPLNGANDIIYDNADFSWNTISGMKYQLQIASDINFNSILFDQDAIKYNNFTLPNNILSVNITYYWRVRAWNGYNYGAWAAVQSFTTANQSNGSKSDWRLHSLG